MKPQSTKRKLRDRGAVLFTAIISFFMLLAAVGLAIDVGRIMRTGLALQRSVDAAAVAAAYLLSPVAFPTFATTGPVYNLSLTASQAAIAAPAAPAMMSPFGPPADSAVQISPAVKTVAKNLVKDNLRVSNVKFINSDITAVTDSSTNPRIITLTAKTKVPTVLLGLVPFIGQKTTVLTASATAHARRLYVALLLDTSGSMCANAGSPCQQLTDMMTGAKAFVDVFKEDDRVSIIRFSTSDVNPLASYVFGDGNYTTNSMLEMTDSNKAAAKVAIDSLTSVPNTLTNIYDALREGTLTLNSSGATADDLKVMVLFTDGAPWTAGNASIPSCDPDFTGADGTTYDHLDNNQQHQDKL